MCVVGFDGDFKHVNPTWTQLLGWQESELLDRPATNVVHPDDHAILQSVRAKVRAGQDPGRIEIRYRHKDGSYRWVWWSVFPHPEEQTIYAIGRDISEQKRDEALEAGQRDILEMVASGKPLAQTLDALVKLMEQHSPDMHCSILLLDDTGSVLTYGAAPSLPQEYRVATDGYRIGPDVGSCGTAASMRRTVIVEDIEHDPLWQNYRALALPHGLRACWSTPIFDPARNVLGTFAVYYDTPRAPAALHRHLVDIATQIAAIAIIQHRDETALRLSEEKFTTIFRHAPVLMAITDLTKGTYIDVNDHALQVAGYSKEDVLGHTAAELGWLQPHERQMFLDEIARYGRIRGLEVTFHTRTGESVLGLVTGTLVSVNGNACLLTVAADITERKRAENALREREDYLDKIINNIGDPMFVKDEQYRFVLVNDAFCALFNLSRDEIVGKTLAEQTPSDQRDHFWRVDTLVLKEGTDNVCEELLTIREGETKTISTRKTRYVDDAGNKFVIGVIHDITERKRLEEQLLQAQKMEAVGTLAGGIAHDFNNMLAAIKGYTQLAKEDSKNSPAVQSYLDAVMQGTHRAAELVRQITAFSRQQDTQQVAIALQNVVSEALVLLRATIPSTIEIRTLLDPNAATILADPTQMQQIMMNLCTNAWHAMKAKPGLIEIDVRTVELDDKLTKLYPRLSPGKHVRLSVTDHGSGMDQATQTRIFEPFFTTKALGEGSGLGLAVVHGIVKAHHGTIVVKSSPGQGTTFELYFPALALVASHDSHRNANPISADISRGRGEKILLVDDEPALVELGSTILERCGYSVAAFTSSCDAFEAANAAPQTFDLVISDLSMPGLSGLDLVEKLRQVRPNIPVIVVSGYVDAAMQERISELGVQKVLLKPFTIESVGAAVHEVLTAVKSR